MGDHRRQHQCFHSSSDRTIVRPASSKEPGVARVAHVDIGEPCEGPRPHEPVRGVVQLVSEGDGEFAFDDRSTPMKTLRDDSATLLAVGQVPNNAI